MSRPRTSGVRTLALVLCLGCASASAADQILTPDGLDPVKIGMTVEQAEQALGAKLAPLDTADGYSTEACWETQRLGDPDPAILYMIRHGEIVRIDITRYEQKPYWTDENIPAIASEKGVHIRDPDVKAAKAHGTATISSNPFGKRPDDYYATIFTQDKQRGVVFEIWDHYVYRMRAGLADAIQLPEGCP